VLNWKFSVLIGNIFDLMKLGGEKRKHL